MKPLIYHFNRIVSVAEQIQTEIDYDFDGPVDLSRVIARIEGLKVVQAALDPHTDVVVYGDGPRLVVLVRETALSVEKRFETARAIGHAILHHDLRFERRDGAFIVSKLEEGLAQPLDTLEHETSWFASMLLTPFPAIEWAVNRFHYEHPGQSQLSEDSQTFLSRELGVPMLYAGFAVSIHVWGRYIKGFQEGDLRTMMMFAKLAEMETGHAPDFGLNLPPDPTES